MKLGEFDVPEVRLIPTTVDTLKEIYKVKKRDKIQSKDLAIFLGFKYGTEPHYYRKIRALTGYGLLDGKGIFQISELGEKLLYPRTDDEKKLTLTKAVLNIPLWREIYEKQGKQPREDNFWAVLMDITKIDPDTAKKNASKILGWYAADITHVTDDFATSEEPVTTTTEPLRSTSTQPKQMSQQVLQPDMEIPNNYEKFEFGKTVIAMPKTNIKKEWDKVKKMLDIYLEDYDEADHNSEITEELDQEESQNN